MVSPTFFEFVVCLLHIYMKAAIQDALQEGIIFKDPTYKVSSRGGISDKSDRDKFLNYNETKNSQIL